MVTSMLLRLRQPIASSRIVRPTSTEGVECRGRSEENPRAIDSITIPAGWRSVSPGFADAVARGRHPHRAQVGLGLGERHAGIQPGDDVRGSHRRPGIGRRQKTPGMGVVTASSGAISTRRPAKFGGVTPMIVSG